MGKALLLFLNVIFNSVVYTLLDQVLSVNGITLPKQQQYMGNSNNVFYPLDATNKGLHGSE